MEIQTKISPLIKQCRGCVASSTCKAMKYDPGPVGVTDPWIRRQNTAQQFITLRDRICQLWKVFTPVTILSVFLLQSNPPGICACMFVIGLVEQHQVALQQKLSQVQLFWKTIRPCVGACVGTPSASLDWPYLNKWEGCVFSMQG